MPTKKRYYPYMDGFRAIAVYWVMLHHMFYFFDIKRAFGQIYAVFLVMFSLDSKIIMQWLEQMLRSAASCGNIGVDMFFVISGFLITGLLTDHLDGTVDVKRFYIRRSFKIIPQYLFAVVSAIVLYCFVKPYVIQYGFYPQFSHVENASALSYFLFLQNYFKQIPMLAHTWSLVVEEHFYVFYPMVLWGICLLEKDAQRRRRALIMVCLVLVVLCNLIRFKFMESGIPLLNVFLKAPHPMQTTLFRVDALAIGCLLKLFEDRLKGTDKFWTFLTPSLFILSLFIYSFFLTGKISVGGYVSDKWYAYALAYLAPTFLFITGYRGFVPIKLIAENPFLRYIGRHSYGIYLWHYILIYFVPLLVPYVGYFFCVEIYVFLASLVGIITTATIENYFLKLRDQFFP